VRLVCCEVADLFRAKTKLQIYLAANVDKSATNRRIL
jgi:hypothetical protein